MKTTDIRIKNVSFAYEDHRYRTPIKFGGIALDRATILNVNVEVETRAGKRAKGFGSMPLGNVWSFPSRKLSYDDTLRAMKTLTEEVAQITADCPNFAHPIDLNHELEAEYLRAAQGAQQKLGLEEPIPKLCTLVVASPFDAAIHDAFGKAQRLNCYHTYGPDFMSRDLAHYLVPELRNKYLSDFVLKSPKPRMLYHLVGALDPLDASDVKQPINDGLPETLPEWIRHNGLTHLKIKLNGDDLGWDAERVVRVDRIAAQTQAARNVSQWHYSLDFNERCKNVEYLLEFLARLQAQSPQGYARIQYIEQPTARVLNAQDAQLRMHAAAQQKPVVIDESLTDLESLLLAREVGYTGVALKACKGQSQALLMAAAAQHFGLFLCVQDLTCPGASLIHSAGLAAHVPGVAAIEANARQYMPAANAPWEARFPTLFQVTDGTMDTSVLTGPGLGAVP